MCGRFVQASQPEVYADFLRVDRIVADALPASYNVAPTDHVYAVAEHDGERLQGTFSWGLIPWWAKDRRSAARSINARAETVATKPAYRDSLGSRRCLIPADGFYEWEPRPRGKLPYFVHRRDRRPMAFAGLWASWKDPATGERVRTCTIVTGPPNAEVARIHDRMPVMLTEPSWSAWLDPALDEPTIVTQLLVPAASKEVVLRRVSTLVNKVASNVPECIAPLTTPVVG